MTITITSFFFLLKASLRPKYKFRYDVCCVAMRSFCSPKSTLSSILAQTKALEAVKI